MLTAIAKARAWIDDLVEGRVASFAEIADQEGKVERHVRFLAPLAFVSPKIIANIIDNDVRPRGITDLAKTLAYSWRGQALDLAATPQSEVMGCGQSGHLLRRVGRLVRKQ